MTNTATLGRCQSRWFAWLRSSLRRAVLVASLASAPALARSDEAPAWQQELAAARLLQAADAVALISGATGEHERIQRLSRLYRDLATKYPDQAAVQKAAGDYFWGVDDTVQAVAYWQRAQQLGPQDAGAASSLASAALQTGEIKAARAQFQLAVDAEPKVAQHHFDLANVLYLFRKQLVDPPALPDEQAVLRLALMNFRQASDLAPNDLNFAQAYAETFYILSTPDWTQALAAWERVRDLDPAHPDFCNGHLARVSLQMGKPEQAEGYLALLHEPASAPLKARLQTQADLLKQSLPVPSPTP